MNIGCYWLSHMHQSPPKSFRFYDDTFGRGHYVPIRNGSGAVEEFVEICPDYVDFFALQAQLLAEQEQAAQERARLLSTVAQVANLLLRSQA